MKLLTSLTPPRTATSKYFEKRPLPGSPSSDPRGVTGGRGRRRRRRRRRRRKVRRRRRRGAAFIKALVPFWRSWFIHICS